MRRTSATVLVTLVAMMGMIVAAPVAAFAQPDRGGLVEDVTGTSTDPNTGEEEVFTGVLEITGFDIDDEGNLTVDGVLAGEEFTDIPAILSHGPGQDGNHGQGQGQGNQQRCDILFLDLGPIHLDVLGLVVDLSQVELDIYAEPGPGNLLGNLLCAVAGLLDGPDPVEGILDRVGRLLDRVTAILG